MPKNLQIGNDIYEYPVQSDGNWGEEATAWAEAVTDSLANVQGANDILITSSNLNNNQVAPTDIAGLAFSTSSVLSIQLEFFVKRDASSVFTESGILSANFDGSDWKTVQESVGDSGVIFTITPSGQVQYTSTNLASHVSSSVRYRAKTIDSP